MTAIAAYNQAYSALSQSYAATQTPAGLSISDWTKDAGRGAVYGLGFDAMRNRYQGGSSWGVSIVASVKGALIGAVSSLVGNYFTTTTGSAAQNADKAFADFQANAANAQKALDNVKEKCK